MSPWMPQKDMEVARCRHTVNRGTKRSITPDSCIGKKLRPEILRFYLSFAVLGISSVRRLSPADTFWKFHRIMS